MIGQTISHYRILEKLGEGGMGVVYKAEDLDMRRMVALKFLHASQDLPRLLREAQTAGSLGHPNICTMYEVDPTRGFIAMEFVEGETLAQRIGGRPLPAEEALALAQQIGEGLSEAHRKGITHRDIKSGNIIVNAKGQAKILDFGLARVAGQGDLTREGLAAGTPGYMAPEQMRGEPADRRTDIWAYGAVLHEMLTGRLPIGAVGALPQGIDRVVGKALAADPAERYQHLEDLLVDLRSSSTAPTSPSGQQRRRFLWAGTASAILLAGGIAWKFFRNPEINSVAVLPFTNENADPDLEYLSDGIAETLTRNLSRIPDFKVTAFSSVTGYRKRSVDLRSTGQALGVRALILGRIQSLAGSLLVNVEMVEAASQTQLWGELYNRKLSDVLTLQAEIAQAIAGHLRHRLANAPGNPGPDRTTSAEVYQLYLKGRYHWNKFSKAEHTIAVNYFEDAIAKDPTFALAYAGLADCYVAFSRLGLPPSEAVAKGVRAARKALELDPSLPEAYASVAWVSLSYDLDWAEAERGFRKAIELNANNAVALHFFTHYLLAMRRFDEALKHAQRALELAPLDHEIHAHMSFHYLAVRQPDAAIEWANKTLELQPGYPDSLRFRGHAYLLKKEYAKALADFVAGNLAVDQGVTYVLLGQREKARAILTELETKAPDPLSIAPVYGALGESGRAFDLLDQAYRRRSPSLHMIGTAPQLDPLRSDPRFTAMLQRLKLPATAPHTGATQ